MFFQSFCSRLERLTTSSLPHRGRGTAKRWWVWRRQTVTISRFVIGEDTPELLPWHFFLKTRNDPIARGRQEHPAQHDAGDRARADDDIRHPMRATHHARQREDHSDGHRSRRCFFAEIPQHERSEDQEHHAVVPREARARPVFRRPASESRNFQGWHALLDEIFRRARPLEMHHHVALLREHDGHHHREPHRDHPPPPARVRLAEMIEINREHTEESDRIERPQVRERHEVCERCAVRDELLEREEHAVVERLPEAVRRQKEPAQKHRGTERVAARERRPSFDGQRSHLENLRKFYILRAPPSIRNPSEIFKREMLDDTDEK